MSADNGIYIGWFGEKEFLVIHAMAIENCWYPNDENAVEIVRYFKDATVFDNQEAAQKEAFQMEEKISHEWMMPLEYGISIVKFSKSFAEYVLEAKEQEKFDETMG